ncbi:hypothetical protein ANRL3_02709 [Anaerolineae bacterium]|nr:hypothetical protein ANRL3_02709 [Anaerolineae bacterium]
MTPNLRARLIVISIVLVVSLSVPLLTVGHDVRSTAGSQPDATSLIDRHCGSLPCVISLPTLPVLLPVLMPVWHDGFQQLLTATSIALPRLDPPPRFTA